MSIKININKTIKVKLTDLGKEIYYHRFDDVNKMARSEVIKPTMPDVDEEGYTRFQLWYFMQLYGEHFDMCKPKVIDPLEIVYDDELNISIQYTAKSDNIVSSILKRLNSKDRR